MQNYNIYLAGGMSGLNFEEYNSWREIIKKILSNCECDYIVKTINPADYYNFEDNTTYDSELEIMRFDLYKLTTSDLVIVNFSNPESLGTMSEIAIAYDRGIPIIGLNEDRKELHSWQISMCNKIFDTIGDLTMYVKNYYLT